jgi:hypothetical protein
VTDDRGKAVLGTVADAARIGESGLRAATAVVEQVLLLSRQLTDVRIAAPTLGGPDSPPPEVEPSQPGDRRRDLRTLRADAERLIELYGDWTRALVDGVTALAEGRDEAPSDVLELGPVDGGTAATATIWLHTFEGPVAAPAALHCSDLVAHTRAVVPGGAITFEPPALDTSTPLESVEITVVAEVPAGTPPGAYRGWLLADGLAEVELAVRLVVE